MGWFYRYIITPTEFQNWKAWIIGETGLSHDALHVYFGLAIFLFCRFIFGKGRLSAPLAWLVTLGFAYLGEFLDYSAIGGPLAMFGTDDHLHDVINTIFWPTVLAILGAKLFERRRKTPTLASTGDGGDQGFE